MSYPTDTSPPADSEPPHFVHLTDDQLDVLADKVYTRMKEKLFAEIGKTVVQKFLYLVGLGAVAFAAYAGGKGWLSK